VNEKLQLYSNLIKKFNPTLNLISPKDIQVLESRHFSDAIEAHRIFMDIYGQSNDYSAYDLGSGNGIPGILWSILLTNTNKDTPFSLVEIDQRKAEFLKHCIRELELKNTKVINKDFSAIEYPEDAIFISRAFMNINKLFAHSFIIERPCFMIKGSTWNNEVDETLKVKLRSYPYKTDNGVNRNLLASEIN